MLGKMNGYNMITMRGEEVKKLRDRLENNLMVEDKHEEAIEQADR